MTFDLSRSKMKNQYLSVFASSYKAENYVVEYSIVSQFLIKFRSTMILFEGMPFMVCLEVMPSGHFPLKPLYMILFGHICRSNDMWMEYTSFQFVSEF